MGILLLLLMGIVATVCYIVQRNYKMFLMMVVPTLFFVGVFLWYFTPISYKIRFKNMPTIEFLEIRVAKRTEMKKYEHSSKHPLYIIEFTSNIRFEDRFKGQCRLYASSARSDFNYWDVVRDKSMKQIESDDIRFVEQRASKFIYHAPFQLLFHANNDKNDKEILVESMKNDLHCKVFFIKMFTSVMNTSEMIIPLADLKRATAITYRRDMWGR